MTFPVENVLHQQLLVRKENSKRNMANETTPTHYWCWILTVSLNMPWSCHITDYNETRQEIEVQSQCFFSFPVPSGTMRLTLSSRGERGEWDASPWQLNGLASLSSVRFLVYFTTDVLSAYFLWVQPLRISLCQGMLQRMNKAQFETITDVHKINKQK